MRIAVISATVAIAAMLVACAPSSVNSAPLGAATPDASAQATPGVDSGIYGWMVAGRGNAPSNPPTVECVRVLDTSASNVVAHGECSGPWRQFRVPLAAGKYVVELGGHWESKAGAVHFVPNRKTVQVMPRQWVKLAPPNPPAPLP